MSRHILASQKRVVFNDFKKVIVNITNSFILSSSINSYGLLLSIVSLMTAFNF